MLMRLVTVAVGAFAAARTASAQGWETRLVLRSSIPHQGLLQRMTDDADPWTDADPFSDLDRVVESILGEFFPDEDALTLPYSSGPRAFLRPLRVSAPTTLANLLRPRLGMLRPLAPKRRKDCACRQDIETFCPTEVKEVAHGQASAAGAIGAGVLKCLFRHKNDLQPQCQAMLKSAFVCQCHEDLGRLCSKIEPGEGRLAACLRDAPRDQLSPSCANFLPDGNDNVHHSKEGKQVLEVHETTVSQKIPPSEIPPPPPTTADFAQLSPNDANAPMTDALRRRSLVTIIIGSTLCALFVLSLVVLIARTYRRNRRDFRPLGYVPMLT